MDKSENEHFLSEEWWRTATIDDVKTEINNGVDINAKNEYDDTALMLAISNKKESKIIDLLILNGADVNAKNKYEETALSLAIDVYHPIAAYLLVEAGVDCSTDDRVFTFFIEENVNIKFIEKMLEQGAKFREIEEDPNTTAIMSAAMGNQHSDVMELTINMCGYDVNVEGFDGETALSLAVKQNKWLDNLEVIKVLLKYGAKVADLEVPSIYRTSLLGLAAMYVRDPGVIEILIKHGAQVNERSADEHGYSPLILAILFNDNPKVIEALLKGGAAVNLRDNDNCTPLMYAAMYQPTEVIKLLLDFGADINAESNFLSSTPTMYAAAYNENPEIVKFLIEYDKNIKKKFLKLLMAATYNPNPKVMETIIGYGNNFKNNKDLPFCYSLALLWAPRTKSIPEVFNLLLENGADVNEKEPQTGRTALMCAVNNRHSDISIIETLLNHGADVNAVDRYNETVLDHSFCSKSNIVELLIKYGADINLKDKKGLTPLMRYVKVYHDIKIVDIFLKYGADLNEQDKHAHTALTYAVEHNSDVDFIKKLISKGAKFRERLKDKKTLLMCAAKHNSNPLVIKTLIKYGIDVNAKNKHGKTALIYAASFNHEPQVLSMLLKYGADITIKDETGKTALDYAKIYCRDEHIEVLKNYKKK